MISLFNGDCLQILKDISSNSVDLILSDLPFGCLGADRRSAKVREQTADGGTYGDCSWDIKIDLDAFWTEVRRIRRNDHTPCLHFCTTKYGFELWESNKKEFRYDLVWAKPNAVGFLSANKKPMSAHEMIYVFSKAGAYYNRVDISGDFPAGGGGSSTANFLPISGMPNTGTTEEGRRCVKSWIYCSNKKEKGGHPTAKPIELYKFLIERYCLAGGTVLDPTFGSGNSGLASKQLGRKYIGIEKDKTFFDKAKKILLPE
jgi:site-specific DNA-methyltransferase (adenine-specific)